MIDAARRAWQAVREAVNAIPKPIRDFVEGCAATGVGGAADAVWQLNLGLASPKLIFAAAMIGGLNAAISFARRRGIQPIVEAAKEPA